MLRNHFSCRILLFVTLLNGMLWAQQDLRPDLVITDLWPEGSQIYFQVMNVGQLYSSGDFDISIAIDGQLIEYFSITESLKPGQRITDYFRKAEYHCDSQTPGHAVEAVADANKDITESNEKNNIRTEYWSCDEDPPVIVAGPSVEYIKAIKIVWETDEDSDSRVLFGRNTGMFDQSVSSATMTKNHSLGLSNLLPGTTYQYKVQSTDPSGNTVTSAAQYFLSPPVIDNANPKGNVIMPMIGTLPMHFFANADDNEGVDRVEFEIDGQTFWVDYDPPFECIMNPGFIGLDHSVFFDNAHDVVATVYDLAGNSCQASVSWAEMFHCPEVSLWYNTSGSFYVLTPEPTWPGHTIQFYIHAKERCEGIIEIPPDPYNPRDRGNRDAVWQAVREVRLYFDDVLQETLYPDDPDDEYYVGEITTGVLNAPSDHAIRIEVESTAGCITREDLGLGVDRRQARMFVTREIERDPAGHYFHVDVTVENSGLLPVTIDRFVERITGFQAVFTHNPGNTGTLGYDVYNRQSVMTFDWNDYLEPDDSMTFSYDAVPVMYEGIEDYQIGDDAALDFVDDYGRIYNLTDSIPHVNHCLSRTRVDVDVLNAFKASDYLMITNPYNLFGAYDHDGCNLLLVKMAELAIERGGVLAFFNGQTHMHTNFDGNDKLKCGNVCWDWRDEIVMADDPNRIRIYDGAHERTLDRGRMPIQHELTTSDALLVGNIKTVSDGYEPLDEIAVITGAGSHRGDLTVYRFNHAINEFERFTGTVPYNPSEGDQVLIGDMIVTNPNSCSEIVLFNQDGVIKGYYGEGGTAQDQFASVYQPGDVVAIGDLLPAVGDEIVIGDVSANEIVIYNGDDETIHLRFPCTLSSQDHLMVCDEGLAVADESADRLDIWQISETGATKVGGFNRTIASDDIVRCGYVLDQPQEQYIFARGSRHDNYSEHDIELFAYSVYNGTEEPGDRHDLDRLINPGGEWTEKMADGWAGNGYLLIVGEIEIIPSFACSYYLYGYGGRHYIEFTDNYYSNTSGDMKFPELSIGRINGNCPFKMADKLQTCIDIARGDQLLDTSSAYVVSGDDDDDDDNRFDDKRRDRVRQLRGRGYLTVDQDDQVDEATFFAHCINRDLIYLTGHGNANVWDGKDSWELEAQWDPGSGAPLVYGDTCLTGRYFAGDSTYSEHWMEFGASAYIGSTEVTYSTYSKLLSEGFFDRYGPGYPLGRAMKEAKRNRMGDDNSKGKYHSAIYHVFGDPKMEPIAAVAPVEGGLLPASAPAAFGLELNGPVDTVDVQIPDYEVDWFEGEASISIPGGVGYHEVYRPKLPAWPVTIHWPQGYQIENVSISKPGQTVTGTGLPLPFLKMEVDGDSELEDSGGPIMTPWPDHPLDWSVQKNPDGSTTLFIKIYPFKTWPETTNYSFTNYCMLDIDYHTSSVEINKLVTDKKVYQAGDIVRADLYIYREKGIVYKPLDVIAEARMVAQGYDNLAFGLPVKLLQDVQALGSSSWQWDPTAVQAPMGDYELQVELKTKAGHLLDKETVAFRIGQARCVPGSIIVDPECFDSKEDIGILCRVKNGGEVNLSGMMVLEILDRSGVALERYTKSFADLAPASIFSMTQNWIAMRPREQVIMRSYVLYDGQQSDVVIWPRLSEVLDGDLNNDYVIDLRDVCELACFWLDDSRARTIDIAPVGGDCRIDMRDMTVLIEQWTQEP